MQITKTWKKTTTHKTTHKPQATNKQPTHKPQATNKTTNIINTCYITDTATFRNS